MQEGGGLHQHRGSLPPPRAGLNSPGSATSKSEAGRGWDLVPGDSRRGPGARTGLELRASQLHTQALTLRSIRPRTGGQGPSTCKDLATEALLSVAGVRAGPRRGTRVTGLELRVSTQGQAAPSSTQRSLKYLQFSRSFPRIVFFLGLTSPASPAISPHSWERNQFSLTLPECAAQSSLRHAGLPHREPRARAASLLHHPVSVARSRPSHWGP